MVVLRQRTRAVMVDAAIHPYGNMLMCHMFSRDEAALLAMADKIGVQRKWIQRPPKASWVHFDISKGKRELAIRHGAIEVDKYECVLISAEQDVEWLRSMPLGFTPVDLEGALKRLQNKREMVARCRAK